MAEYRDRQKNGSQVARIVLARPGRSGKQQQEQNSRNLGTVFLPGPVINIFQFLFSLPQIVRQGQGHRVQEGVQRVLRHQVQEDVLHVVQDQVQLRLQEDLQGLVRQEGEMVGGLGTIRCVNSKMFTPLSEDNIRDG